MIGLHRNWKWIMMLVFASHAFRSTRAAESLKLEPVLRLGSTNQQEQLVPLSHLHSVKTKPYGTAFVAVVSASWPAGLVPLFAVEDENKFELRRLPPRGIENSSEPLFFALPREDEPHATRIAGRWSCAATNAQGGKHFPDWELAIDGERIAGRFSPQGEYRVAYITGGTFRSNRFELYSEYFQDRYTLRGQLRGGQLAGTWRQHDDSDRGTWSATRDDSPVVPAATNIAALYEWRRGNENRYGTESPSGEGWQRATKPLCRVWVTPSMR
jgi:hypothetical protein